MNRRIRVILLLTALTTPLLAQSLPVTKPRFTISKETTLIEGPLLPDGTLNYIPAINALIGEGVKDDDNAAIPLLLLQNREKLDPQFDTSKEVLQRLGITVPAKPTPVVDYLSNYINRKKGVPSGQLPPPEESDRLIEMEDTVSKRPWKKSDLPEAAEWLQISEAGLKVIEDAARRPRFFIPFIESKPGDALPMQGMPDISVLFLPRTLLLARAMNRAGEGDLPGAYEDLRRVRTLLRLAEQQRFSLFHMMTLQTESTALKAYTGIAQSGLLNLQQLAALRTEIEAFPPLVANDPVRQKVECMFALDALMQCLRGHSATFMRLMSFELDQTKPINMGDWNDLDWDVVLREMIRLYTEEDPTPEKPFHEEVADINRKAAQAKAEKTPGAFDAIENFMETGQLDATIPNVEAFLKRRPTESRTDFSRRIARWFGGGGTADARMAIGRESVPRLQRIFAHLAVDLAEYRLTHGTFPETLAQLRKPAPIDLYTGKPLLYQRTASGYTLWSAGMNQQDDQAAKDDILLTTDQPPPFIFAQL